MLAKTIWQPSKRAKRREMMVITVVTVQLEGLHEAADSLVEYLKTRNWEELYIYISRM
jgi:hypothetical protein